MAVYPGDSRARFTRARAARNVMVSFSFVPAQGFVLVGALAYPGQPWRWVVYGAVLAVIAAAVTVTVVQDRRRGLTVRPRWFPALVVPGILVVDIVLRIFTVPF